MKKENIVCHDCGRTLEHNEEFMGYEFEGKEYFKCKSCHQKDAVLRNVRKAEVYSRVVGYIRPVQQWNEGKKTEFSDRKEFLVSEPACC